jgi:hypothetical protein
VSLSLLSSSFFLTVTNILFGFSHHLSPKQFKNSPLTFPCVLMSIFHLTSQVAFQNPFPASYFLPSFPSLSLSLSLPIQGGLALSTSVFLGVLWYFGVWEYSQASGEPSEQDFFCCNPIHPELLYLFFFLGLSIKVHSSEEVDCRIDFTFGILRVGFLDLLCYVHPLWFLHSA